jgi:aldose 1-epimerase
MYGFEYSSNHPDLNQPMICLWFEKDGIREAEARLLPEFGANLCGFMVHGIEFLYPAPQPVVDPRHFGTPVLYPFPGIISGRRLVFDGVEYTFPANRGEIYRHGYVMGEKFSCSKPVITEDSVSVKTWLEVNRDHPLYNIFPIENCLELTFTLKSDRITIDILATNLDPYKRFPFGFGLHPYLNIIGPRDTVYVQVPMEKWLNLTSGDLPDPSFGPADLRQPTSLSNLVIDDIWWGMKPDAPQSLSYQAISRKFSVIASEIFTHSVTYCPKGAGFFCLENWTCSPDAHNLAAKGRTEAAHLLILDPGQSVSGTVSYLVETI